MPELSRLQFLAAAALVVGVVLVGSHALRLSEQGAGAAALVGTGPGAGGSAPSAATGHTSALEVSAAPEPPPGGGPVLVHVVGAVRRPGVYRLKAGARLQDAVQRAGGRSAHADLSGINLAAKATDGEQVVVPRHGAGGGPGGAAFAGGATAVGDPATGAAGPAAAPVDVNTATLEQLETLDGIGPALAQRILDRRTQRGAFRSVEELTEVPGIGPKRLAALRAHVQV